MKGPYINAIGSNFAISFGQPQEIAPHLSDTVIKNFISLSSWDRHFKDVVLFDCTGVTTSNVCAYIDSSYIVIMLSLVSYVLVSQG